jgi:predicted NBD/HSP70 family sugar kinase
VLLENDANAGAVGETLYGAARGVDDLIYLRLSTGIGAGLVLGGRPYHGFRGLAGEIGHVMVDDGGPICRCGNRGCLEAVASPVAVAALLERSLRQPVSTARLLELVAAEDRGARRAVADAGELVGRVLSSLVSVLNPELVVVGGELAAAGDVLLGAIRAEIERHSVASGVRRGACRRRHARRPRGGARRGRARPRRLAARARAARRPVIPFASLAAPLQALGIDALAVKRLGVIGLAAAALLTAATPAFGAGAPSAITGPVTSIGPTSATATGKVNPNGLATTWYVEYGTSTGYGSKTSSLSAGSGTTNVDVTAPLSGLAAGTTYHYRVVATNSSGTARGADGIFTTAAAPAVVTGAASDVSVTTAKLAGTVDPNGRATTWYFEYGTSTATARRRPSRAPARARAPRTSQLRCPASRGGARTTTASSRRATRARREAPTARSRRAASRACRPTPRAPSRRRRRS